jgi:lipopolysaccharide/colanic/teichoic acid biosynthesis glycosyltransferase
MPKLRGINYLLSDEKQERDATMAARLLRVSGWTIGPLRRLLAHELDIPYEETLFHQDRVVVGNGRLVIPKLTTLNTTGSDQYSPRREAIHGTHDPRAGRVGRWARRLGLDELPQLELAANGRMWLVGMRPLLAEDLAAYEEANPALYRRWQDVGREARPRAGITGLSQLHRRHYREAPGVIERQHVMELDIEWMTNASAALDRSIVRRTPYELIVSSVMQRGVRPDPTTPLP